MALLAHPRHIDSGIPECHNLFCEHTICVYLSWRCRMDRFDFQRYPVSSMIQDVIILLTPVILMLIGFLLLE